MKRTVYLGIGDGGLWLALVGEPIPKGATVLTPKDGKFWLRQAVPPMAHPTILHAVSEVADAIGYPFHGAAPFADLSFVMDALADAIDQKRLIAYRNLALEGGGKGPSPLPPPGPAPPAPAPTKVNPLIDPPVLVVVVQKKAKNPKTKAEEPYTHPKRHSFTLKTDAAFDGTATFTCDKADKVRFFSAEKNGTEIKFDGKANVWKPKSAPAWAPKGSTISSGATVWAEAAKPSDKKEDITIKLELSGGSNPVGGPDTSKITSVEVTLDIHASKPDAASAPALSKDDKVFVGRNLLAQDKANHFLRGKLVIQQVKPSDFEGELLLKAKDAHVDAFKDEDATKAGQTSALPFTIKANKVPAAGQVLWAQGGTPSDKMMDSGFLLGIKGVEDEGDRVTATSIKLQLDICGSRTKDQADKKQDPTPLSEVDKVKKGRFVHKQDTNFHGRALLVVRKVVPADFKGKIVLEELPTKKTELYDKELAKDGGTVVAPPKEYDLSSVKNEDHKFWVQGKITSAALRDAGYFLHLADDPPKNADTVLLTVVEFTKIKATIKSTPPNTPANSAAAQPPIALPLDHTFESTKVDPDFTNNPPLVLLRNAQPDIKLELTATPANLPIAWDVVRNPADHVSIGKAEEIPHLTPNAAKPTECKLNADNKGSFRLRPYIDTNGSTHYDDLEPSIPMNLVLVDAKVHGADRSGPNTPAVPETISAGSFSVSTGQFNSTPFQPSANEAMIMDLDVELVGGNADGKLGLDKVFGGLVNMVQVRNVLGIYTDRTGLVPTFHNLRFLAASNQASASSNYGTRKMFLPGDAAAVPFGLPLLDSGRRPSGLGGQTATMGSSQMQSLPAAQQPAVGQRIQIWCQDSPGWGWPSRHPVNNNARLTNVVYQYTFIANFVLWTNVTKSMAATGDAADRVYSVVRIVPWYINSSYTTDFTTNPAAPTFAAIVPFAVTAGPGRTISPVGRAQDNGVEVRPPSGITGGIVADTH